MIYNFIFNSTKASGISQVKTFNVNFGDMQEGEYKGSFTFQSKALATPTSLAKCFIAMIYVDVGQSKTQETKILNSYTSTGQTINITNTQSNIYTIASTSASNNSIVLSLAPEDIFIGREVYIAGIIGSITAGYYNIVSRISSTEYTIRTTAGDLVYQIDAVGPITMTTNTMTVDNTAGLYNGLQITIAGTTQNGVVLGASFIDEILSPTTVSLRNIDNTLITGATTTLTINGVNVINNYGFQLSKCIGLAFWNDISQRIIKAYKDMNPPFTLDVKPTFNQVTISILDESGNIWGDNVGALTDWVLVLSLEKV